jgi:hypothetical protein
MKRYSIFKSSHSNGNSFGEWIAVKGFTFGEVMEKFNELFDEHKQKLGTFCEEVPQQYLDEDEIAGFYCDYGCSTESYTLIEE